MNAQTQALIERVNEGILEVAQQEERALDEKLKALENLDEDDFEMLRQRRRMELQKKARQEQDWKQLGHGRYAEVTDTKEFFALCKKSERVVAHFYRSSTARCQIVDAHLAKLAQTHLETRFVKVDAEKNPFLVERLQIILMPSIILIRGGKTDHTIRGFDEFGGTDDFATEDVEFVLASRGVLDFAAIDRSEEIAKRGERAGFNTIGLNKIRSSDRPIADEDDDYT